jgi:hypothetical protein
MLKSMHLLLKKLLAHHMPMAPRCTLLTNCRSPSSPAMPQRRPLVRDAAPSAPPPQP